jgi:hypothetical protein
MTRDKFDEKGGAAYKVRHRRQVIIHETLQRAFLSQQCVNTVTKVRGTGCVLTIHCLYSKTFFSPESSFHAPPMAKEL